MQKLSLFAEAFIVFRRQIRMNLRNPTWIIIGIMQPVLYLTLFGPLLKPLVSQFGASNAYTFFVPGLLVQLGIVGALFAGFSLIAEWREGVVEAERVTPARRASLLLGRVLRDMVQVFVQALILVGLGWALGMDAHVGGAIAGVTITMLLAGAFASVSNAIALTVKSEDVLAPLINSLILPILLLSGILLPMTLGPIWLQRLSDVMPFRWVVSAVRDVFTGGFGGTDVLVGFVWAVAMFAAGLTWGVRVFCKDNA